LVCAVGHNAGKAHAANFKLALALTRTIEPTVGPGELATLEDAARFIALTKPFRWRDRIGISQPSCF
jgi:hypothetical protein